MQSVSDICLVHVGDDVGSINARWSDADLALVLKFKLWKPWCVFFLGPGFLVRLKLAFDLLETSLLITWHLEVHVVSLLALSSIRKPIAVAKDVVDIDVSGRVVEDHE